MDENLKKTLINLTMQFLRRNYDYLWLKTMLEKGRATTVPGSTLITGPSCALGAVYEKAWKNAVNCSMHSQDLYYNLQCIRRVLSSANSGRFERCFIMMVHCVAFMDLSLSKESRKKMISEVYYPIFHDAHHWEDPIELDPWAEFGDVPEQMKAACETAAENSILRIGTYYSDIRPRFTGYVEINNNGGWSQAPERIRQIVGAHRAAQHNRLLRHKATLEENKGNLRELVRLLYSHNITPILVVAPVAEEYSRHIREEMREGMLEMVDSVPEEVHYVDFNEAPGLFGPEDFLDSDHLSASGAEKMSGILVDMFGK